LDRFLSLADVFGLQKRFIPNASQIMKDESLLDEIDYDAVDEIMKRERERSLSWLQKKLAEPVKEPVAVKMRGGIRTIQDRIPVGVKKKILPLIKNTKFYQKYIKK